MHIPGNTGVLGVLLCNAGGWREPPRSTAMCRVMCYGVPSPFVLLGNLGLVHEPVPTGFHVLVLV